MDTANGATDDYGKGCDVYADNLGWCIDLVGASAGMGSSGEPFVDGYSIPTACSLFAAYPSYCNGAENTPNAGGVHAGQACCAHSAWSTADPADSLLEDKEPEDPELRPDEPVGADCKQQ